jgi:hypothetical protein
MIAARQDAPVLYVACPDEIAGEPSGGLGEGELPVTDR